MTYRSDHDAALARVAALESENARLLAALEAHHPWTPPTKPPSKRVWLPVLVLIPLVVGMSAAIYALTSAAYAPQYTYTPRDEQLYRCGWSLAADRSIGPTETLEHVARTTGCRPLIRARLDNAVLRIQERSALEHWRDTEEVLAEKVSRITAFYANHRADDASGEPLWREYNDAFDKRHDALEEWLAVR